MATDSLFPNELKQKIAAKNGHIPDTLFHYTDGGAVIGMVQNKELWATSVQYMNDPNELHFFIDEVIDYCNLQICRLPERKHVVFLPETSKEDIENEMAHLVLEDITKYLRSRSKEREQICLISLSENGDLLSQWRAYASNGGYSVGFDRNTLQELAASQERIEGTYYSYGNEIPIWDYKELYKLLPCIYTKREEQKLFARETIDNALRYLKENSYRWVSERETPREVPSQGTRIFLRRKIGKEIIQLSSILKDASFEEEQEWRLVSNPISYENLSYRSRGSLIIPFHKFRLTKADKADAKAEPISAIKEVYVGPGSEREKMLSAQTLGGLFRKNNIIMNDEAIKVTDTTFAKNL